MNRWEGKGGLTRDPEVRFLQSGVCLWNASVAVNGARWDGEVRAQVVTTVYVAVGAIGWQAERLAEMDLHRGDEVYVVGELAQREIEQADGKKERKTHVEIVMLWPTRVRAQRSAPRGEDPWTPKAQPPTDEAPF